MEIWQIFVFYKVWNYDLIIDILDSYWNVYILLWSVSNAFTVYPVNTLQNVINWTIPENVFTSLFKS